MCIEEGSRAGAAIRDGNLIVLQTPRNHEAVAQILSLVREVAEANVGAKTWQVVPAEAHQPTGRYGYLLVKAAVLLRDANSGGKPAEAATGPVISTPLSAPASSGTAGTTRPAGNSQTPKAGDANGSGYPPGDYPYRRPEPH